SLSSEAPGWFDRQRIDARIRNAIREKSRRARHFFQSLPIRFRTMGQIEIDGTASIHQLLRESSNHERQFAAFKSHRVVFLHESFAVCIEQTSAVSDGDIVASEKELLHQESECSAGGKLHFDESCAGAKSHRGSVARVIVGLATAFLTHGARGQNGPL